MPSPANDASCLRLDAPVTEVLVGGQAAPRVRLDRLEALLGAAPRAWFSVGLGLAVGADDLRLEQALPLVRPGLAVSARLISGGTLRAAAGVGPVLFEGRIVSLAINLASDGESLRFEAEDPAADLLRQRVGGQRIRTAAADEAQVVDGLDLVFNPEGRPNASDTPYEPQQGDAYTIFAPAGATAAVAWTLDKAVTYLLAEFAQESGLATPAPSDVTAAVGDMVLGDVSLEGHSLGQALDALLELAGARVLITAEPGDSSVSRRLEIWSPGQAPEAWLSHQAVGSAFDPAATDFVDLAATMHLEAAPRRYVARGDRKVYESTFDLVAGWEESLQTYNVDDFSPGRNPDFVTVRDVFRKWVLNEAGWYTDSPYNRGDPPDLSAIFEGAAYVRRPRRLLPCLSRDLTGRSQGVYAEVSFDGGTSWERLTLAARVLTGEGGLYLTEDTLPNRYLAAAMRNEVRVRVTAAIESDACLEAERSEDGATDLPGRTRRLQVPGGYRYRRVAATSRFCGSAEADEADDTARLQALVDAAHEADQRAPVPGRIVVPWLALEHRAGERVPGVLGRGLDLALEQTGYRTDPVVRRVCHTFAPTVQTELELE